MVEKYGMMWAWYHPLCEAPNWELPYIPEIEDATGYTGSRRGSWTADTCIQEIAENGVDVAHLKFLHGAAGIPPVEASRSEEHTSELQSLMRISYAVFCLKKKLHEKHSYHKQTMAQSAVHDINNIIHQPSTNDEL